MFFFATPNWLNHGQPLAILTNPQKSPHREAWPRWFPSVCVHQPKSRKKSTENGRLNQQKCIPLKKSLSNLRFWFGQNLLESFFLKVNPSFSWVEIFMVESKKTPYTNRSNLFLIWLRKFTQQSSIGEMQTLRSSYAGEKIWINFR